jgi:TRAP transporter TAXI family solute receptor
MKKRKLFSLVAVLTLVAMILSACGGNEEEPASPDNDGGGEGSAKALDGEYVTILTGGSSGVYFPLGGTLAKVYQEQLGAIATSQSTAASAENAKKLNEQKAEIGFLMGDTAADAYEGVGSFADSGAQENLRSIAALYANYLQIVALKDSGIKTVEDLKGKKVAVGAPGSGTEISAQRVINAYGLSYDDIEEDFLSFSEGVEGMKNGTVDAVVISSGLPNAGVLELATTKDITLVEISEEKVNEMAKDYPAFFSTTIPQDAYEGLEADVNTLGVNNILMTHKDVPEETVYLLTQAFFDNLDALKDTHNAAKNISLENAQEGLPAPMHPGAEKFFNEQ